MSENNISNIYIKDLLDKADNKELSESLHKIHIAVCEALYKEIIDKPMNIADLTPNQILQRGIVIGKFAIINEMLTGFMMKENDIVRAVFNCKSLSSTILETVINLMNTTEMPEEVMQFYKKYVSQQS